LENLAIIAYRQPITRAEIEYLRGVDSGGVIKTLLEKKLIKILGKKDIPGRPLIYGTTRHFLEMFSLKDLKSLPTLREIEDLAGEGIYEQQEELPLEGVIQTTTDETSKLIDDDS
jgi:segregation and condensation protein B